MIKTTKILPVAALAGVALCSLSAVAARAQAPAAPAPTADIDVTSAAKPVKTRTVKELVKTIAAGAGTGIVILVDSSVAAEKVPVPTDASTAQNFEAQLSALVDALPKGATWAKLYLPTADTKTYRADDVSDYALAQSKLFGTVGAAPAGTVEVLGKVMPADKAQPIVDALNLKPVYLVMNPKIASANAATPGWATLSDDQKQTFVKTEAQKLIDGGPQAFADTMSKQMMVMGQMFSMMSPDQKQQYQQAMMEQMRANGGMFGMMGGGRGPGGRPRGNGGGGQ